MTSEHCPATVDLVDGRTLECRLELDHAGPVHDDHGEQWGDPLLPAPRGE